jgi:hypothetical protein
MGSRVKPVKIGLAGAMAPAIGMKTANGATREAPPLLPDASGNVCGGLPPSHPARTSPHRRGRTRATRSSSAGQSYCHRGPRTTQKFRLGS